MTTTDPDVFASFDNYEKAEVTLSRLVVESYLTPAFYEFFCSSWPLQGLKKLPGSCLLLRALETCNASVSHGHDGAAQ
jgi:hypothetical protein